MSCQYVTRWRKHQLISEHSGSCEKCQLKSEAKELTIDVHEWPLPERDLEAKAAVFELDVPTVVSKWRDITYSILIDMLSVEPGAQNPRRGKGKQQGVYSLRNYAGLQKFVGSHAGRLQLALSTSENFSSQREQRMRQQRLALCCVRFEENEMDGRAPGLLQCARTVLAEASSWAV